ncbi:DUF4435 domain-containing protein [Enterovibrio calviensis]|uniref:DUF4435 domain-containing protein n=1 Tax=Enterovibrio calviensis TaxID=91359 RepID=UPI00048A4346|nr:DUF4435 domain-containing protein [Enterovibrio calviensis]
MSAVEYSREAVNVLNRFHRCEQLIYVEGDDDILFWEVLFNYFELSNFKVISKDGSSELDKYTDRLISEDLNIIIARDSDYKSLTGKLANHERLITTYGYSIENTLFISEAVIEITKLWIKDNELELSEFSGWIDDLTEKLRELIYLDVTNDCYELYLDVIGDNCSRYMATQSCANVDVNKVNNHHSRLQANFCENQIAHIVELIDESGKSLWEIIRGHFLQSAILKFISHHINRKGLSSKLSHDALYTNAIQELKITFNEEHRHFEHYCDSISPLVNAA